MIKINIAAMGKRFRLYLAGHLFGARAGMHAHITKVGIEPAFHERAGISRQGAPCSF